MDMNEKKEKARQLELFSQSIDSVEPERNTDTVFHKRVSLNVEHAVVLAVAVLMLVIFIFSIGVEKGRKITRIPEAVVAFKVEKQIVEQPAVVEAKQEVYQEKIVPKEEVFAYTIQVASFKNKTAVEDEAKRLKKKGYETMIIPKGNWIILCVGKFGNKQQAQPMWQELRKKYSDCVIRKL
jgi:hypothetical protein